MILFPGLIGSISAAGKTAVAPTPLNLQISLDNFNWQEGNPFPLDNTSPNYFNGETRTYYVRAIGTGTENITISFPFVSFAFFISGNPPTISGGQTITFNITRSGFGAGSPETVRVQSNAVGGDKCELTVQAEF